MCVCQYSYRHAKIFRHVEISPRVLAHSLTEFWCGINPFLVKAEA